MPPDDESVDAVLPYDDSPRESGESSELLRRARRGDRSAVDALFARMFPWLRLRTRGRLPCCARGVLDTNDVVQDVLLRTIRRISGFESASSVAFRAYLLRAVDHRIRDELRRVGRRGTHGDLTEAELPAAGGRSPLEQLIDGQAWQRYLGALKKPSQRERRLIVSRGELGYPFRRLALIGAGVLPALAPCPVRDRPASLRNMGRSGRVRDEGESVAMLCAAGREGGGPVQAPRGRRDDGMWTGTVVVGWRKRAPGNQYSGWNRHGVAVSPESEKRDIALPYSEVRAARDTLLPGSGGTAPSSPSCSPALRRQVRISVRNVVARVH